MVQGDGCYGVVYGMGLAPNEFWWCRGMGVTEWCMVWGWLLRSSGGAGGWVLLSGAWYGAGS